MDRTVLELLANLHGVAFDENMSDDDLQKALSDSVQGNGGDGDGNGGTPPPPPSPPAQPTPPATPPPAPSSNVPPAVLNELREQAKTDTYIAALLADLDETKKAVGELKVANRLQEVRRRLVDVGNARRVLTPATTQKLSELVAAMPPKAGDKVLEIIKEILDNGTVELGERGRAEIDNKRDAGERFESEVNKLMEADKNLTYADATSQVAANDPRLFEQYQEQAYTEWR